VRPHLRPLVQLGFLASYHLNKAASGQGFVVVFRPGALFERDYERFYRQRQQADFQFDFHADQHSISEPLKVAYLFVQKRTGQTPAGVSTKEKETARQLLGQIPFDEIEAFIDYALVKAKRTNYEPQSLGGIRQYVPGYLQNRGHRAADKAAEAVRLAREREEATRLTYDQFRRSRANQLFNELPEGEQSIIIGLARAGNGAGYAATNSSFAKTLFESAKARITAERHREKIATFEQWTANRHAA
jgi:hypothetical protein